MIKIYWKFIFWFFFLLSLSHRSAWRWCYGDWPVVAWMVDWQWWVYGFGCCVCGGVYWFGHCVWVWVLRVCGGWCGLWCWDRCVVAEEIGVWCWDPVVFELLEMCTYPGFSRSQQLLVTSWNFDLDLSKSIGPSIPPSPRGPPWLSRLAEKKKSPAKARNKNRRLPINTV